MEKFEFKSFRVLVEKLETPKNSIDEKNYQVEISHFP